MPMHVSLFSDLNVLGQAVVLGVGAARMDGGFPCSSHVAGHVWAGALTLGLQGPVVMM
jgi:hypothetical protein